MEKNLELRVSELEKMLFLSKNVLSFDEASKFLNLSKSYLYKLTSGNLIPHYKPQGKMLYFEKAELEAWLRQNPVKTQAQIEQEAQKYIRTAFLGQTSFREYLRAQYTKYSDSRIEFIDRLLDIYNAEPGWWAESLTSYRDALTAGVKDPLAGLPGDYQEWLKLYGELLEAWPVIRERAASLTGENQLC